MICKDCLADIMLTLQALSPNQNCYANYVHTWEMLTFEDKLQ